MRCAKCRTNLDYDLNYERNGLIYCRNCAIIKDNEKLISNGNSRIWEEINKIYPKKKLLKKINLYKDLKL